MSKGVCTRSQSISESSTTAMSKSDVPKYSLNDVMEQLLAIKGTVDVTNQKLDGVSSKLDALQSKHDLLDTKVTEIDDRLKLVEETQNQMLLAKKAYEKATLNVQISSLANEMNNKRFNVIIEGVPKLEVIESPEASGELVRDFLVNILKINNGHNIGISDAHRLAVSGKYKGRRPPALIFKLVRLLDKRVIATHLSNLKAHNAKLSTGNKLFVNLYHLPMELEKDRKSLKSKFDAARKEKRKPKFKFNRENGQYCLHVGNVVHKPVRDDTSTAPSLNA